MKKLFLVSLFLGAVSVHAQTTDYDNATVDTWVAGNPANEAVSLVNQIICFLKNATGPNVTDFIGKKFKSVVYMAECEQSSSGGEQDKSRGTGSSSQSAAQGDVQSSSATSGQESKDTMIVVNDVATRALDSDPITNKAWVLMPDTDGGAGMDSGDREIYLDVAITSGVSTENPYGAFTMNYTMTNAEAGFLPQGATVGEGYLNVSGSKAEFIERTFGNSEMQAYADFSQTEEGDVKGVIVKGGGLAAAGPGQDPQIFKTYYAFNVDKSANLYCEKFLKAQKINFDFAGFTSAAVADTIISGPTDFLKPETGADLNASELTSAGISTAPKCLSTAASLKKKSVWQYGVYTQAGLEYTGANETLKAPFPIYDVTSGGKELRGYASDWGVHVDYEVTDAEALAASWKNEQDSSDTDIYSLSKNYLKVEKYTNSFLKLDDIHKVRVRLYIGWANSSAEKTKFNNLGFVDTNFAGGNYPEYEGYWDKDNDVFCFDTRINWAANSDNIDSLLGTCSATTTDSTNSSGSVVVFTGAQWFTQMGDWHRLHLWSPETGSGYAINKVTAASPSSVDSTANPVVGIRVQSREWIDLEDISAPGEAQKTFICLRHCPTVAGINASAKAALDRLESSGDPSGNPHSSPYNAAIGSHYKAADYASTTPDGQVTDFYGNGSHLLFYTGDHFDDASVYINDASNSDDVALYVVDEGKFYEGSVSASNEVTWSAATLGSELTEAQNYTDEQGVKPYLGQKLETLLRGQRIQMTDYDQTYHPYRTRDMGWAIESGLMVENTSDNRNAIDCDKTGSPAAYFKFGNNKDHPRIVTIKGNAASAVRLCYNKIREGFNGTYYRFFIKPRAQWTIKTGSQIVNFFKPETMYFDTSQIDTAAELAASNIQDKDKNKIIRLEFNGARQLWGIPGGVWDFCKNEAKGDQVRQWNSECYRYIDRFVIPDGLNINTKSDGSGTSYKVKALGIDEFLTPTSNPSDIATMFDGLTVDLLPSDSLLKNLSPKGGDNFIGNKPSDSELEGGGKAQVIHGKKVSTDS
ncbi:hypothetical protein N9V05_01875 [Gammaproteobacteria bacterium]|nr:hypothetical protein [Gammaproteobacteria bacterium]